MPDMDIRTDEMTAAVIGAFPGTTDLVLLTRADFDRLCDVVLEAGRSAEFADVNILPVVLDPPDASETEET